MDEVSGVDRDAVVVQFGPDLRITVAEGLGAVVVLLAAIPTSDSAGRLLLVVAALILASYAITDLVFNPRIAASTEAIVLHSPFARARLSWAQVESIDCDTRHRLGLRSTALEVDAGAVLAQFSRRALGTDPAAAGAQLRALAPHRLAERLRDRGTVQGSEGGRAQPDRGEDQHGHGG